MRFATAADVPAVRMVIGLAFETDPMFRWMFPDDEHRLEMIAAWCGVIVDGYAASGRIDVVEVDGSIVAVAIWRFPEDEVVTMPEPPSLMGLMAAFVGTERTEAIASGLSGFGAARPEPPYAYLHFLAVAPSHQGRGLGKEIIAAGLAAADAAGLDSVLDTSKEANLAFYGSFGFEVRKALTLGPDGPSAWSLLRPAK